MLQVYRHKQVVFGVNCSPFLLAAVIDLHLKSVSEQQAAVAQKLLMSFYVDNCATSVSQSVSVNNSNNKPQRLCQRKEWT